MRDSFPDVHRTVYRSPPRARHGARAGHVHTVFRSLAGGRPRPAAAPRSYINLIITRIHRGGCLSALAERPPLSPRSRTAAWHSHRGVRASTHTLSVSSVHGSVCLAPPIDPNARLAICSLPLWPTGVAPLIVARPRGAAATAHSHARGRSHTLHAATPPESPCSPSPLSPLTYTHHSPSPLTRPRPRAPPRALRRRAAGP